jgi:hypothetical protein
MYILTHTHTHTYTHSWITFYFQPARKPISFPITFPFLLLMTLDAIPPFKLIVSLPPPPATPFSPPSSAEGGGFLTIASIMAPLSTFWANMGFPQTSLPWYIDHRKPVYRALLAKRAFLANRHLHCSLHFAHTGF